MIFLKLNEFRKIKVNKNNQQKNFLSRIIILCVHTIQSKAPEERGRIRVSAAVILHRIRRRQRRDEIVCEVINGVDQELGRSPPLRIHERPVERLVGPRRERVRGILHGWGNLRW